MKLSRKKSPASFYASAKSMSMAPVIQPGDIIRVDPIEPCDAKMGDIVVFRSNHELISHRVVFRYKDTILIKGDNEKYFDKFKINSIIGIISKSHGKKGNLDFLKPQARIISLYYIFYSLLVYAVPIRYRDFLNKMFRGRRYLVKHLLQIH